MEMQNYDYNTPQFDGAPQTQEPKQRRSRNTGLVITLVAMSLVLMLSCAVTVSVLANRINQGFQETQKSGGEIQSNGELPAVKSTEKTEIRTASEIVESCMKSVVSINVQITTQSQFYGESTSVGSGSGVILTSDGYIVTCHHVIDGATSIAVTLFDGTTHEATLTGSDSQTDLAVIKIDVENLLAATFDTAATYAVGDEVYAVGNPLGEFASSITQGILSGTERTVELDGQAMNLIQTDAAINPGNSGGGLFSVTNGNLIGIVNAKSYGVDIEGIGFAIPAGTAAQIAADFMEHGYVTGRPYLGITMQEVIISGSMWGGYQTAVCINYVEENSPAYNAGLKEGDYILAVGDTAISTADELRSALSGLQPGDTASLSISRNGNESTVEVVLGERSGAN